MPEFVHWLLAHPVRWLVPAISLTASVSIPIALWWEKRHPTPYTREAQQAAREASGVDSLAGWAALSTEEQAAADERALRAGHGRDLEEAEARERAAHLELERARTNAMFHP